MALGRWQTMWQLVKYSNRSSPLATCRPYAFTPQPFIHVGPQSVLRSNIHATPSSVRSFSNNNTNSSPSPTNDENLLAQILGNQEKQQEQQRAKDTKDNFFLAVGFAFICYAFYAQRKRGKTMQQQERELLLSIMLSNVTKKLSERSGESEKAILDSVQPKALVRQG